MIAIKEKSSHSIFGTIFLQDRRLNFAHKTGHAFHDIKINGSLSCIFIGTWQLRSKQMTI